MACEQVASALTKCPFLHSVAASHGEEYARQIACNPLLPVSTARRPLLEEADDFHTAFALFHGHSGLVPLVGRCLRAEAKEASNSSEHPPAACPAAPSAAAARRPAPLPLASMSMNFFSEGNFGEFFKRKKDKQQQQGRQGHDRAPKPRKPHAKGGASNAGVAASTSAQSSSNPGAAGSVCPMRKLLGPLSGFVFNSYGKLQCPEPIIRMRAALAATQPVRELRPQALPVKLLAVGAVSAGVNVPCGAWREHYEKFSPGWFAAVHASIPFIAMLRKAVIMPKYAILFTLATAIAGQQMGARMERRRLQVQAQAAPAAAASVLPPRREVRARMQLQDSDGQHVLALASATLAQRKARNGSRRQQRQELLQLQALDSGGEQLPCQLQFKQLTVADWRAPCMVK